MESMDLPVLPPVEPMLAKAQAKVPPEEGVWAYERKWDGFRALVFRDGDEVVMQSRSGKELGRYFPELEEALRDELAPRCVLDGEVVSRGRSVAVSGWTGSRSLNASIRPPAG